jgi:hypothetical protein
LDKFSNIFILASSLNFIKYYMRKFGGDGIHKRIDGGFDRRFGKMLGGGNCLMYIIILIIGIAIVMALFEGIVSMFAEFTFWEGAAAVTFGLICLLIGMKNG